MAIGVHQVMSLTIVYNIICKSTMYITPTSSIWYTGKQQADRV